MTAPMQVLHPSRLSVPPAKRIAFAPIAASAGLAAELEQALRSQTPTVRGELQLLTSQDLLAASPVRLASTAPLTGDMTALLAARNAQAELLLMGEVVQEDLGEVEPGANNNLPPEVMQYAPRKLPLIGPAGLQRPERVAVAWRVYDVASASKLVVKRLLSIALPLIESIRTCNLLIHFRASASLQLVHGRPGNLSRPISKKRTLK